MLESLALAARLLLAVVFALAAVTKLADRVRAKRSPLSVRRPRW
jgi:hypothetical protein